MSKYFFRRLLIMLPTLFVISVVAFWLSKLTPGDPAECGNALGEMRESNYALYLKEYKEQVKIKKLDLPNFYFTINSLAHPDTLERIYPKFEREINKELIQKNTNWPAIQTWRRALPTMFAFVETNKATLDAQVFVDLSRQLKFLRYEDDYDKIAYIYRAIDTLSLPSSIAQVCLQSKKQFAQIGQAQQNWKLWVPTISWNGSGNQYHQWIRQIINWDFGYSCRDRRPAGEVIKNALKWTLMMTIPAIFLSFLLAIPLGIFGGLRAGSRFDRWSTVVVFILNALPAFWVAILLLVFFTTPEYSRWLDWFPSIGLGRLPSSAPFWSRFWETASHLILPIICLTYGNIAFISRQMRSGVLGVLPQAYVLTARAKGLSKNEVVRKHVLKNSLFPILTLMANVLPAAISGAVVIEFIFNIPGMGRTTLSAILSRDWPVVYAIFFLGAVLTIIGIFITDVLYAWADPRVKFKSTNIADNE